MSASHCGFLQCDTHVDFQPRGGRGKSYTRSHKDGEALKKTTTADQHLQPDVLR